MFSVWYNNIIQYMIYTVGRLIMCLFLVQPQETMPVCSRPCFPFYFWVVCENIPFPDIQLLCEISWGRLLIKGSWAAARAVLVYRIQYCSQVACRYGLLYPFWIVHSPLNSRICSLLKGGCKYKACNIHLGVWACFIFISMFLLAVLHKARPNGHKEEHNRFTHLPAWLLM